MPHSSLHTQRRQENMTLSQTALGLRMPACLFVQLAARPPNSFHRANQFQVFVMGFWRPLN